MMRKNSIKKGLYFKPLQSAYIQLDGIEYKVPRSFLMFVRVEEDGVYLACRRDGRSICKLEPVH